MNIIAINIAILLSANMNKIVVAINKKCLLRESGIIFKKDKAVPHISLLMGGIKENDLRKIASSVADITSTRSALLLEATQVNAAKYGSDLSVALSPELETFHTEVVQRISPYLKKAISRDSFINYQDPDEERFQSRKKYIEDFAKESSLEKYYPHVTFAAGRWSAEEICLKLPISFKATSVGVFQLGDYCTCVKKLASFKLKA